MRELLTVPNLLLRKKCREVDPTEQVVIDVIEEMKQFMYSHRHDDNFLMGLSAPQFGENIKVSVFYHNPWYRELDGTVALINPQLLRTEDFRYVRESCLSLPDKFYLVNRARRVRVKTLTLNGTFKTYKTRDLVAQIIQHELNHLDGVLIDQIGKLTK